MEPETTSCAIMPRPGEVIELHVAGREPVFATIRETHGASVEGVVRVELDVDVVGVRRRVLGLVERDTREGLDWIARDAIDTPVIAPSARRRRRPGTPSAPTPAVEV